MFRLLVTYPVDALLLEIWGWGRAGCVNAHQVVEQQGLAKNHCDILIQAGALSPKFQCHHDIKDTSISTPSGLCLTLLISILIPCFTNVL